VRGNSACTISALAFAAILIQPPAIFCQQTSNLTAREIFYSERTRASQINTLKAVGKAKREESRNRTTSVQAAAQPADAPKPATEHRVAAAPLTTTEGVPSEPAILTNAQDTQRFGPLGLRVSVLRILKDGTTEEVDPEANFRTGDRLRLKVEVTDRGHLYVINRGSSGIWSPMFPSPNIPNSENVIDSEGTYNVPEGYGFTINDPPGTERLFVIFSRKPYSDNESLTEEMNRRATSAPGTSDEPSRRYSGPSQLMASTFSDARVTHLRNTVARDLIIEKVDDRTPGTQKEKALYVVDPRAGADAKVVLDIQLRHP